MKRFFRFCLVGGAGFVIDAGILTLFTQGLGFGPIHARVFSFSVAVLITWRLNRSWTFYDRVQPKAIRELLIYVSMQGLGLSINFGVYSFLVLEAPRPFGFPFVALCIATGASLLFNFTTLAKFVFPGKNNPIPKEMGHYSGTDNLEIMADAVNYNNFLVSLILEQADSKMKIVDFGAGIGTFAKICAEHGLQVRCVEPDIRQSEVIRQSGFPVSKSLAEIPDASVDLIYTLNVLEHIQNDTAILREMSMKLRAGGRLLIYVPAFQMLYSSMDKKVGHYRRYTRYSLFRKVREVGLTALRNRYVDSLGFAASLLYKLIGSDSGAIDHGSLVIYDRLFFPLSRGFDHLFGKILGKNVYLLAEKPTIPSE